MGESITDGDIDAVSQIEVAVRNPLSAVIGGITGGLVPLGTFAMIHGELDSWLDPLAVVPAAGLVFSAMTVYRWSRSVFRGAIKAIAFVAIAEGMMAASATPWLNYTMLVALIAINAIGNGCWLASRRDAHRSATAASSGDRATPKYVALTRRTIALVR